LAITQLLIAHRLCKKPQKVVLGHHQLLVDITQWLLKMMAPFGVGAEISADNSATTQQPPPVRLCKNSPAAQVGVKSQQEHATAAPQKQMAHFGLGEQIPQGNLETIQQSQKQLLFEKSPAAQVGAKYQLE
jgi:hypothetical protein